MSLKDAWKHDKSRGEFACAFQDIIERNKENLAEVDFVNLSAVNQVTFELREMVETRVLPITPKTHDELNVLLCHRECQIMAERAKIVPKITKVTRSVVRDILTLIDAARKQFPEALPGGDARFDEIRANPMGFVECFIDIQNRVSEAEMSRLDTREREIHSLRKKFNCNVR